MGDRDWRELLPDLNTVLQYVLPEESREEIIISQDTVFSTSESRLEGILKEHEGKEVEISHDMPKAEADREVNDFLEEVVAQQKKVGIVYYEPTPVGEEGKEEGSIYVVEEEEESKFAYMFVPRNVQVHRVSQNVLGPNVLGRTWPGSGQIEILNSLYGDAFREVLQHELNHINYPHLSEQEVREKTKMQVANPIYH